MLSSTLDKTKSFVLKCICSGLCLLVFLLTSPTQVQADMVDALFEEGTENDALADLCQGRKLFREVVENLPETYPNAGSDYGFWVGDLDEDNLEELIVRIWTYSSGNTTGNSETLLVYDTAESNGAWTAEFLFETVPPVPIRYGFLGNADGTGVLYTAITNSASGDCVEGTVKLNDQKTALEYTETRSFSLAKNESVSENTKEIFGYYDSKNEENTDWGPLDLESIVDQEFILGKDNNWFKHTASKTDPRSGFYNVTARQITPEQYAGLIAGESEGTISEINAYLNRPFEGVCLGLTSTMALVKEEKLSLHALDANANSFYDLGKPTENLALFNQICCLHIAQNLIKEEDFDCMVNCQNNPNRAVDLEKFVSSIRPGGFQIMTFTTKDSGHALLIKELTYFKSLGFYDIRFYDVNSLSEETPNGCFHDLYIKDDFSAFCLTDGLGKVVTQDNCCELNLLSADTLLAKAEKDTPEKEQVVDFLCFSKTLDLITFEDGAGNVLKYDCNAGQITGESQSIQYLPSLVNTMPDATSSTVYARVAIADSDTYTLTCAPEGVDIQINTGDRYYTLKGEGMETAVFSKSEGIKITGTDFTFTVGLLTEGAEKPALYEVTGTGQGTVTFSETSEGLQMNSEASTQINNMRILQDGTAVFHEIDRDATTLTLTPNGAASSSMHSFIFWIVLCSIFASVLVVILFLILFIRSRKRDRSDP